MGAPGCKPPPQKKGASLTGTAKPTPEQPRFSLEVGCKGGGGFLRGRMGRWGGTYLGQEYT